MSVHSVQELPCPFGGSSQQQAFRVLSRWLRFESFSLGFIPLRRSRTYAAKKDTLGRSLGFQVEFCVSCMSKRPGAQDHCARSGI